MKTLHDNKTKLAALTIASMLLTASALGGDEKDKTHHIVIQGDGDSFVTAIGEGDHAIDAQMVEVRVINDDVVVKLNGEEVPAARLKRMDDQIIVLDDEGNEIKTLNLRIRAGDHSGAMWFSDEEGHGKDFVFGNEFVFEGEEEEPRAMLGVALAEPSPALLYHLRLEPGTSTLVSGVYEGLPAAEAGIELYDVIVEIDGDAPADPKTLRDAVAEREAGDRLKLTLIQEGSRRSLTVKLEAFDRETLSKHSFQGNAPGMIKLDRLPFGNVPGMRWRADDDPERNRLFFVPDGANEFHSFEIPMGEFKWRSGDNAPFGDFDVQVDMDADYEAKMRAQIEQLEERLAEMSQMLERMLDE